MKVGVLALQGAFREHIAALSGLGVEAVPVRLPGQLDDVAGLVIPGGESTAISKLMETYGFYESVKRRFDAGMAIWGTCAGAILIATEVIDGVAGQRPLGLMDMRVRRNAYGRQVDSFEVDLAFAHLGAPYCGVFIRAPWIESVGADVETLAQHEGAIVAARQGRLMATTFHPELTDDDRVARYFVTQVIGS